MAAEIDDQNSCQSRFSGIYLVFEVLQEREFKEMLAVAHLKSGRFCYYPLFVYFPGEIVLEKSLGTTGSPRHPSTRHRRPR